MPFSSINARTITMPSIPASRAISGYFAFFFMVTTVLKKFDGLPLTLPRAKKIEKLGTKRHVSYIWVDQNGKISVDDKIVSTRGVRSVVYERFVDDPQLIISMKIDQRTNFGIVSDIHQELREAGTLRINYSSKTESG